MHDLLPIISIIIVLVTIDCNTSIKSDVNSTNETALNSLSCDGGYFLRGASVVCEGNASWSIGHPQCKEGYYDSRNGSLEVSQFLAPQGLIVNVSEIRRMTPWNLGELVVAASPWKSERTRQFAFRAATEDVWWALNPLGADRTAPGVNRHENCESKRRAQ